ncbi:unnamed protein product [Pieris macdunnoughi]|uniref:MADF domain-containing protein n=1 Tax=Pieris macdunnoughi TaxID=345717 RepID=A0A821XUW4_9NEOP|nr:unnamed protein product [Pieris macdunnoughi]
MLCCGPSGSTCKTRWNNIRDNYRKSLKKTETKSGQKKTNVKLYKYYEQLHFLKKYFNERPTVQSVEPEKENSDSETNEPRNTVSISPDIPAIENAKKHREIFMMRDWVEVFRMARSKREDINNKPYKVNEWKFDEFWNLHALSAATIKNR